MTGVLIRVHLCSSVVGSFCAQFLCLLLLPPGKKKEQSHTDADRAVGDIERRKIMERTRARDEVKVEKVDDVMVHRPVQEISRDAAEDEPERNRAERCFRAELAARKNENDERDRRDDSQ